MQPVRSPDLFHSFSICDAVSYSGRRKDPLYRSPYRSSLYTPPATSARIASITACLSSL